MVAQEVEYHGCYGGRYRESGIFQQGITKSGDALVFTMKSTVFSWLSRPRKRTTAVIEVNCFPIFTPKQENMAAIKLLLDTYQKAVFEKDLDTFASIFDENVCVFDMWSTWSYDGLPAWKQMANGWFISMGTDRDKVEFRNVQTNQSGELATANGFITFTAVSETGESLRSLDNRFTLVAEKKTNGWKIIHMHTSGPVDFETMMVLLQQE